MIITDPLHKQNALAMDVSEEAALSEAANQLLARATPARRAHRSGHTVDE